MKTALGGERGGPYRTPESPIGFERAWRRYRWLRRAAIAIVVVAPIVPMAAFLLSADVAAVIAVIELVLLAVLLVRGTFSCPACGAVMARATLFHEWALPRHCWQCQIVSGHGARPSTSADNPRSGPPKWLVRQRPPLWLWAWLTLGWVGPLLLGADVEPAWVALPRVCPDLACTSAVRVSGPVPPEEDAVDVEVCLDDRCAQGRITQLNISPPRGPYVAGTTKRPLAIGPRATKRDGILHFDVGASYARMPHFKEAKVRITASTGQVLVDAVFPLQWRTTSPNGERCDPTCDIADVTYELASSPRPHGTVEPLLSSPRVDCAVHSRAWFLSPRAGL